MMNNQKDPTSTKSQDFHFHSRGDRLLLEAIFHGDNSSLDMIQEIENTRGETIHPIDPFKGLN
jgi:hypothetical protein